ncbi:MAG TPA: hypothetical protein VG267_06490 [Terracidiphilus sp.]|jgi:hypothetical protein|nr:hypothetical protein [Terracidiphilus sp.]
MAIPEIRIMNAPVAVKPRASTLLPALVLFFLAPLVAEYLLGDLPITLLPALLVLAPMYGAGALLIREVVRATGRGWPSVLLLGAAYGILEEAFTTQSLFNPDYLHMHMGLLNAGYIPALGMGAWWTLWMLNVHPVWSITTPIVLTEALFPSRAQRPWLSPVGRVIVCVVFAIGLVANTVIGWRQDHFIARPFQFGLGAVLVLVFVALALGHRWVIRRKKRASRVQSLWITGACAFIAASAALLIGNEWGWWSFVLLLVVDLIFLTLALRWITRMGWSDLHSLSLAAAAALAYAWHSFIQPQIVGKPGPAVLVGKVIFALGAIVIVWIGVKRMRGAKAKS